ncbi:AAA family ATPase [Paenibacillus polymyxa]|uniref:AAA family ATPase n=1 Tax=Paenibacillus TaxID=44249 RepID=UPI000737D5AC|nr:AAA family ATPase [Paenibacillus polymyxa]
MKVDSVTIQNIGGIKDLNVSFNDKLNMICGMNGVGKSTILECIVHAFSFSSSGKLKRNARTDKGIWKVNIDGRESVFDTNSFSPSDSNKNYSLLFHEKVLKVIYIKDQRHFEYQKIDGIRADEERNINNYQQYVVNGMSPHSIKTWFSNRVLFEPQGNLSEAELFNLVLAKKCFSLLDPSVTYSHIDHSTLDTMVDTSRGRIYFEYLSSGFKSTLFILLGLIKEIEFNMTPKVKVSDFDGIILIDEADAHLHPYWQGPFVDALRTTFTNAQIIITTHSPHMIQEANSEELIALGIDEEGEVIELDLFKSEYGFKGWTVEEILEDVMGLKETRSNKYIEIKNKFEHALDNEDVEQARELFDVLNKMLHPRSPMRKVYELQLGSLG